jgi:glucose/arabinose dehydrogenase
VDGSRWGRPVDVLVMPDGSLLVSDDLAGAVYRITYSAT